MCRNRIIILSFLAFNRNRPQLPNTWTVLLHKRKKQNKLNLLQSLDKLRKNKNYLTLNEKNRPASFYGVRLKSVIKLPAKSCGRMVFTAVQGFMYDKLENTFIVV